MSLSRTNAKSIVDYNCAANKTYKSRMQLFIVLHAFLFTCEGAILIFFDLIVADTQTANPKQRIP